MPEQLSNMTEPELKRLLTDIANHIKTSTDSLFMVVLFDEPGVAQYISNAKREDCIRAMEETALRFKKKEIIERN